ncbi:O-antigen ligase family protein [Patescibacteria group bacterium]|nr:O-antigen ligase family protein [Patescibacteria group bacterium]
MILSLTVTALVLLKSWKKKIIVGFIGLLSYYILILTASRVSFGAYLVGTAFVFWFSNKRWWLIPFFVFSILGMVFSDDLGQRYAATFNLDLSFLSGKVILKKTEQAMAPTPTPSPLPIPTPKESKPSQTGPAPTLTPTPTPTPVFESESEAGSSGEPFEPTALAVGRSTDIRLKVEWPRAIRAFLKNPILGTGYSSISLATDNDYLRMFGEIGILGVLAFGAVIIEIARRMLFFSFNSNALKEERIFVIGVIGASIGYFLNATFIDVFEASKVAFFFWIMVGAALKVIDLRNNREK